MARSVLWALKAMHEAVETQHQTVRSAAPVARRATPPAAALQAKKQRKDEFAGAGAAVQAIGLLLCLTLVGPRSSLSAVA